MKKINIERTIDSYFRGYYNDIENSEAEMLEMESLLQSFDFLADITPLESILYTN